MISNKAINLIEALREQYTPDEIKEGFVLRTLDDELFAIGNLVVQRPAPTHIYVWFGMEVTTESPMLDRYYAG